MKSEINKIVLTNGVFDVIHRKHIELLSFCKEQGDYLIVAIDSDRRVRETKGSTRPINSEMDRKFVLNSLKFVDEVVIFDTIQDLRQLHKGIRPNIYVKGGDWQESFLRETDGILPATKVILFPYENSYSSTNTIERMRQSQ
jgi:D-beta-D-heptose 7-phosphate kinase/D-beta-D-heptose 1-phosphate adenosyltransferase